MFRKKLLYKKGLALEKEGKLAEIIEKYIPSK